MRLGGRLAAAIDVLDDIARRHRPAADALKDWGLSHRFAGAGDRGAIGNIVYDALRRRRSASWLLDAETPRAAAFGAMMLEWGETPDTLAAALDGDRFAPEPLTAAERAVASERLNATPPDAIASDSPDWCLPLLEQAFGADWAAEGAALAGRPPLDLRANTLLSSRDKVLAELEGTDAAPCRLAPQGMRIPPIAGAGRHPNVQAEPAYRKGWFEVQDEGSQIAAKLAGAEPGMQVLDFCAGAGGKTLALAAAMENRGQIFAHDSEKQRLAPIFERLQRAGARDVQVVTKPAERDALAGRMDLVLVDAPCTGSGTWRRRPDAKWRLTDRQLAARVAEQTAILDQAARFVKPGGSLVYVTCSVFEPENGERIAAFLGHDKAFSAIDQAALWRQHFPGQDAAARIDALGIRLSPRLSGTDGFFVSAMRRKG